MFVLDLDKKGNKAFSVNYILAYETEDDARFARGAFRPPSSSTIRFLEPLLVAIVSPMMNRLQTSASLWPAPNCSYPPLGLVLGLRFMRQSANETKALHTPSIPKHSLHASNDGKDH